MGTPVARARIVSISSMAACHGPKGDYETQMVSDRRGDLSFRQFLTDHKNVAGILDGRGWQLGPDDRAEWIDEAETSVLRNHEFPLVALDLRKRFHDFSAPATAEFEGQSAARIEMIDERGHPASAYFSVASHLPLAIVGTNPRSGGTVTTRFDAWRTVADVRLVSHVTILIGSEKWVFDFKSLQINAAGDEAFQVPEHPIEAPR
jgi:hypothetical protein